LRHIIASVFAILLSLPLTAAAESDAIAVAGTITGGRSIHDYSYLVGVGLTGDNLNLSGLFSGSPLCAGLRCQAGNTIYFSEMFSGTNAFDPIISFIYEGVRYGDFGSNVSAHLTLIGPEFIIPLLDEPLTITVPITMTGTVFGTLRDGASPLGFSIFAAGTETITLSPSLQNGQFVQFDDSPSRFITFVQTPEPSTLILTVTALGLLLIFGMPRRWRLFPGRIS